MHTEYPLEIDTVPIGHCIAGVTIIMFGFLRKMKSKTMVVEAFVLFLLLHMNAMVEARPLMCLQIDI